MANRVLSVIQPGGNIGTKYSIRSTGIRCFPQDPEHPVQWQVGIQITNAAEGCCKFVRHASGNTRYYTIRISCSDIHDYWDGLTISFQVPLDDDIEDYFVSDSTRIQIYNLSGSFGLGYKDMRTHSGLPLSTLKKGEIYVAQYNGSSDEWIVYDTIKIGTDYTTTITNGNYLVPTGNAVYDYVNSLIGTVADSIVDGGTLVPNSNSVYDYVNGMIGTEANSIVDGGTLVPNSNAVYDYVNSMISQRWEVVVCGADADEIPKDAEYKSGNTTITGTRPASADTMYKIYMVRHDHSVDSTNPSGSSGTAKEIYDEWITISTIRGSGANQHITYFWEKIGNTDIDTADIAIKIADSIIGSIADHTVNEPTGIGTVYVGEHNHSIYIPEIEVKGEITPGGTIDISDHDGLDGYNHYTPSVTISSFTPSGSVASTFIGTVENVAFSGTMSTITMSTYNVPVNANTGDAHLTIEREHHILDEVSVRPIGTIGTTRTGFISVELDDGSHSHTMPSVQVSIATIDFTNNSSVIISTNNGLDVNINAEVTDGPGENLIPIPVDIKIGTQATYILSTGGEHNHLGTLNVTAIATLSNVGSASVYSVENEILTLTPSVPPISTAEVTISQQPISIGNAGDHSHTVNRYTDAEVTYDFKYYKLGGTTNAHSHSITGTYAGLIGTTVSSNTGSNPHTHQYKLSGSDIAQTLSVSLSTIYMSGVIPHTHTVGTITMKSEYTPAGMLTQSQTIEVEPNTPAFDLNDQDGRTDGNIRPAGSSLSVNGRVSSTFAGTEVRPTANGKKVFFGFIGTRTPVTSYGEITGETADATIGTKTVTVGVISTTLAHAQRQ